MRLERITPPVCVQCGTGVPGAFDLVALCAACRSHPHLFEAARAPWQYRGTGEELLRQFKYRGRWRIGTWLARHMAMTAQAWLPLEDITAIIPVPLHWVKQRLRGVNPAQELAARVARILKKPCLTGALRRRRWTSSQTRLNWQQRQRNVHEAFTAQAARVRGETVLLIDDVLTSGATVNACARALTQAGARRVFVLAAARTPHLR